MLKKFAASLLTVDTDGVVENATGDLSSTGLTLIQTSPPDHVAHQLAFVASASVAAVVFTIVGKDADGKTITESVTGVTTSPVETTNYYSELTSITPDATLGANTLDVGWVDEAVSPTIRLEWETGLPFHVRYDETGTLETDIQLLMEDPGLYASQEAMPWVLYEAELDDILDTERFEIGPGYTAARVKVNSYSTGATLAARFVQGTKG